jgi:small nuclear ribonucleoprotein (snRNP)-like protein
MAQRSPAQQGPSYYGALRGHQYGGGGGGGGSSSSGAYGGGSQGTEDVFFGGVSSLAEHLDSTILLVLRDGRLLLGTLSSYDQYGSIVLEKARERLSAGGKYADIDMNCLYMIRGENIMLMGVHVSGLTGPPLPCSLPPPLHPLSRTPPLVLPASPLLRAHTQDEALDAANPHMVRSEREEVEELIAADLKRGAVKGGVAGLTWAFD